MPVVTAIRQQQKRPDRYSVYIDGRFSFSLTDAQLIKAGLVTGQELAGDQVEDYQADSLYGKALQSAFNLLSYRARSRFEMTQRLKLKRYEPAIIDRVLGRLTELKLLDDEQFAASWVAQPRSQGRSAMRLQQELYQKGIDRELAHSTLGQLNPDHDRAAASAAIERYIKKKAQPERQKLLSSLARQGFPVGLVIQVLDQDFSEIRLQ
jgi:regulatory protein